MKEKIIKIDAEPLEGFLIPITECKHFEGIGDCKEAKCLCVNNENCYFKQLKRLEQENEKIKKQYNCYACENCNGKEDYINLEKHHKGLRKQFDELVKRNNTLSLRIEELEKENKELKANKGKCAFKSLDNTFCDEVRVKIDKLELDKDCLNASLETAREYRGIAEVDRDKYKQALEKIAKETKDCKNYCNSITTIEQIVDEVLNENS